MKAIWNGVILAESDQTIVVEGNHYFPPDTIKKEFFRKSNTKTTCGWKGVANYFSITVNDNINIDCAWYYPEPRKASENIKNHVAFWKGVKTVS